MKLEGSMGRTLLWLPIAVAVMSLAASISIFGETLVSAWIPFGMAALIGIVSLPFASVWKWFTSTSRIWVNCLCNFFVVGCLAAFVILGGNYVFASEDTAHLQAVTVLKKHCERHYRTRRMSRNTVTGGVPYYTYHVLLEMPDGHRKLFAAPYTLYKEINAGSVHEIVVESGLWGMPIMKGGSLSAGL